MILISTSAFRPLRPIDVKYATVPVQQGFNWGECLADFESGVWHLVVFRSVRSETAEDSVLAEFDERAYQEARGSSGFRFYFRGEVDEERRCLSLCVWDTPEQARAALHQPDHRDAVAHTREWYEEFSLERYRLSLAPDRRITIEPLLQV